MADILHRTGVEQSSPRAYDALIPGGLSGWWTESTSGVRISDWH
jgi:hypothetical protein